MRKRNARGERMTYAEARGVVDEVTKTPTSTDAIKQIKDGEAPSPNRLTNWNSFYTPTDSNTLRNAQSITRFNRTPAHRNRN